MNRYSDGNQISGRLVRGWECGLNVKGDDETLGYHNCDGVCLSEYTC